MSTLARREFVKLTAFGTVAAVCASERAGGLSNHSRVGPRMPRDWDGGWDVKLIPSIGLPFTRLRRR